MRNNVREHICVRGGVVIRLENGMLRRFGHVRKIDDKRVMPHIYGTDVDGNVGMLFWSLKRARSKIPKINENI